MHRFTLCCGGVIAAVLLALPCSAQRDWVLAATANRPNAQLNFDLAHDAARGQCVLFGGSNTAGAHFDETWEYDGMNWMQLSPASIPPTRVGTRLAYDAARGVMVMFGGQGPGSVDLDDTWTWDGTNWTQHSPATPPPARQGGAMWYDSARGLVVLYGGANSSGSLDDTWVWDGTNWTQLRPTTSPPARFSTHAAYDSIRDRAILFGGAAPAMGGGLTRLQDTWEFDGADWTQLNPHHSPTARWGSKLAHDLATERVVLFGGNTGGFVNDTWEWDGFDWHRNWTRTLPGGRDNHCLAYDATRSRLIVYGGYPPGHDTWEYFEQSGARWRLFGRGCPGTAAVPELGSTPGGVPALGATFNVTFSSLPAATPQILVFLGTAYLGPIDLAGLGMPGCLLFALPDVQGLIPTQGGFAPWPVPIPNLPFLSGVPFYLQGVVPEPGVNGLGLIVTNAGEGIIG